MAPPAPGRNQYSLPHTSSQRNTDYAPNIGMFQATGDYFRGYVNFSGRSSRSQYWWPIIPLFLLGIVSILLDYAFVDMTLQTTPFNTILSLATILPSLAVGVRRLHDVNRSGWWLFIVLIPLVGAILLIVWFCTKGDATENRFG